MAFYYRGLNDTFYEVVKLTEENNASIDVMRLFVLLWRSFPLRQLDNKKKDETEKEKKKEKYITSYRVQAKKRL